MFYILPKGILRSWFAEQLQQQSYKFKCKKIFQINLPRIEFYPILFVFYFFISSKEIYFVCINEYERDKEKKNQF